MNSSKEPPSMAIKAINQTVPCSHVDALQIIARAEETGVGVREQPPESTTSEWFCCIIMAPRRRIIAHYLPRLHVWCVLFCCWFLLIIIIFFVIFRVVDLVFLCVMCVVWGGVFSVVCEWEWSRGAAHSARHLINTMKWGVAPDYCYRVHSSPSCYLSRAWNNDSVCWALLAPIHSLYYNYLSFI